MSGRSRREHKPTSKFLNYTQEIGASSSLNLKTNKATPPKSRVSLAYKKQTAKEAKTSELKSPSSADTLNTSNLRKSNRQHKPNKKLKGYVKPSFDDYEDMDESSSSSHDRLPKKAIGGAGGKGAARKVVATVSPMVRKKGIETPIKCPKHITVGLVDCFEGLTDQLAKIYPGSEEMEERGSGKRKDPEGRGVRGKAAKRPLIQVDQEGDQVAVMSAKQKRLEPNTVRNLTKTKKTKITTVVERVACDKRKKTVLQNHKSKLTKQYPLRQTISNMLSSDEEEIDTIRQSPAPRSLSSLTPNRSQQLKRIQKKRQPKLLERQSPPHQRDIRETLKKFLIMGTKVANAISETLKHNEESLLSKSSAFEKKCLSLVHALATQGADLEEDDMEKVLKLLDEEQEERRVYRQTFLESLRMSHLTNMALYSQMLRLLRTL